MSEIAPARQRFVYLDIIRIISCFLVIVNHSNSRIFLELAPSPTWFASLAYFFVSKVAVPLFIMASGAVLLGRAESFKQVGKRVLRIILVLALFSFIYFINLNPTWQSFSPGRIKDLLLYIFRTPFINSFWYLYMYLGLLIMLPSLRKLIENFTQKDYLYFFFWSILFLGAWPILSHYQPQLTLSWYFSLPLFNAFIGLLIAGYFFHNFSLPVKRLPLWAGLTILALLALELALTYREYYIGNGENLLFLDNDSYLTISLMAICAFFLIKHFTMPRSFSPRATKCLARLGRLTFGVYLLNDLLIEKGEFLFLYLDRYLHPLLAMLLFELAVLLCGLAITFVLRLVPGLKKIL